MSTENSPAIPRTANLLACRQWWKVCFLYGDQDKYYRQVYGKAASKRLAMSAARQMESGSPNTTNDPDVIFPCRSHRGILITKKKPEAEETKPNSRVTILDDPFLLGLDPVPNGNQSRDSGISTAEIQHDLKISEEELKKLQLSRSRTGYCPSEPPGIPPRQIEKHSIPEM
ncbi:hypothetical protein DMENIID0001_042790 [Sergentomyia squamirostris]